MRQGMHRNRRSRRCHFLVRRRLCSLPTVMPESLRVFVSSVMAEGYLAAERARVRQAIDSLEAATSWTFENHPAEAAAPLDVALREVRRCDIFVLLVSNAHSPAVQAELDEAERSSKPVLAFVEKLVKEDETPERAALLRRLALHKYREFEDLDELEREVGAALVQELVAGYRDRNLPQAGIPALVQEEARLQDSVPRLAVRAATSADRDAVLAALMELEAWYPDIGEWARVRAGELDVDDSVRVAGVDGSVDAISIARDKGAGVRKLATLYVRPTARGEALGPHLVREEVLRARNDRIRKLYVTCADEIADTLIPILLANGFAIEGASAGRYRPGSAEWILGKTLVFDEVLPDEFVPFVRAGLIVEAGGVIEPVDGAPEVFDARLPRLAMASGRDAGLVRFAISVSAEPEADYERYQDEFGDRPWRLVSICGRPADTSHPRHEAANWSDGADIAASLYPVRLEAPGQSSLIVTIRPEYANALIPDSRSPSLFSPTRLQLRPDNVFYRAPDRYRDLRRGSRILFYVSEPERALRGWGVITSVHVGTPADCFARYGTRGVFDYDDLTQIADNGNGNVLAIAFDWYEEFDRRVGLRELQQIIPGYTPQSAWVLGPGDARTILDRGSDGQV